MFFIDHKIFLAFFSINLFIRSTKYVLRQIHFQFISLKVKSAAFGKCKVMIDGNAVLACQTQARENLIVTLPDTDAVSILETGQSKQCIPTSRKMGATSSS